MTEDKIEKAFRTKFNQLNENNKQYVLTMTQTLLFAQMSSSSNEDENKEGSK